MARRLAEIPNFRVLLIEAGGDPTALTDIPGDAVKLGLDLRWKFKTTVSPNECQGIIGDACAIIPGKVLGGSSTINYMMYVRGNPRDFDDWAYLGNIGWSYDDVLPYFRKLENFLALPLTPSETGTFLSEGGFSSSNLVSFNDPFGLNLGPTQTASSKYHGVGGPFTGAAFNIDPQTHKFREAALQAAQVFGIPKNIDINGGHQIGITNLPGMVDSLGYRYNSAKAYLMNIPDNLKVCKYSTVTKVLFKRKRATGVELLYKPELLEFPRTIKVRASKETILSGGPINSPAILERSGIGRRDVLEKAGVTPIHELPMVGENFQDQYINLGSAFKVDYGTESPSNPLTIELTSLTAFVNLTDPRSDSPDVQFILKTYSPLIAVGLLFKPQIGAQVNRVKPNLLFFSNIILRQQIPGSTHITQSADPNISPKIKSNQLAGRRDIELTVAGTRLARKIMANDHMRPFKPEPFVLTECSGFEFNSEDEIICNARHLANTLYHQGGTTAMGPDPLTSVVDPTLRVHGIERLRVIDSGVMPLVTRGNTEVPTIMIGEKGADLVKAAWL